MNVTDKFNVFIAFISVFITYNLLYLTYKLHYSKYKLLFQLIFKKQKIKEIKQRKLLSKQEYTAEGNLHFWWQTQVANAGGNYAKHNKC